jgi:hypothetical protein
MHIDSHQRAVEILTAAGKSFVSTSINGDTITVQSADPTAQAVLDAVDWSAEAHAAWQLLRMRRHATEHLDAAQKEAAILRALAMIVLDENNLLRDWITQFQAATAAATNLANLQTRVAALPSVPQRTAVQLRDAIKKQVTDGNVDA